MIETGADTYLCSQDEQCFEGGAQSADTDDGEDGEPRTLARAVVETLRPRYRCEQAEYLRSV